MSTSIWDRAFELSANQLFAGPLAWIAPDGALHFRHRRSTQETSLILLDLERARIARCWEHHTASDPGLLAWMLPPRPLQPRILELADPDFHRWQQNSLHLIELGFEFQFSGSWRQFESRSSWFHETLSKRARSLWEARLLSQASPSSICLPPSSPRRL